MNSRRGRTLKLHTWMPGLLTSMVVAGVLSSPRSGLGEDARASTLATPGGIHAHTDRDVYTTNASVVVSIENGSADTVAVLWQCDHGGDLYLDTWVLQRHEGNGWRNFDGLACPALNPPVPLQLRPGASRTFQRVVREPGRYRVEVHYDIDAVAPSLHYIVYTNEFQVEESTAIQDAPWGTIKVRYK